MPAKLKKRGSVYYIEGAIRIGQRSIRVRETTGCRDTESAQIVFARRCAEISDQLLRGEGRGKLRKVPGFATAAADYEEFKRTKEKKPLGHQDRRKLLTLAEYFGEKPVDSFEAEDWDDFVAERLDDAAPGTVRRWFAMFRPPLRRAGQKHKFMLPDFVIPSEGPIREIFLEPADRDGLLAAYAEHAGRVARMLCLQGCRQAETLRLQWPDVSFSRNTLTFRITKNGESRVVPMHPEIREMPKKMYMGQKSGPVFSTPDGQPYADRRAASHGGGADGSGIRTAHATALRKYTIRKLMAEQNRCRHCGCVLREEPGQPSSAVVELTVIRGTGEREQVANYALSCAGCRKEKPAETAAKVNWFRIHDWRHHWASWFMMDGGDPSPLMALGGWKTPKMIQRYVKLSVSHLEKKLAQSQRREVGGNR